MKKLAYPLIILLSSGFFFCTQAQGKNELQWHNFNDGYALGTKTKKPMIVDFYADWCSWCKKMDVEVFQNPEVEKILARDFVTIRVNTEGGEKINFKGQTYSAQDFASAVGVTGLPTLLFIDRSGELVTKLPGYVPVDTIKPILGYIKSECYTQKISFDDYKNGKVKCK